MFWALILVPRAGAPTEATIRIDAGVTHQALDGFGQAENSVLAYPGSKTLSDALRALAVDRAYRRVGINMGVIGTLLESPGGYDRRQNDNGDPFLLDWNGFDSFNLANARQYVVDLARPLGFTGYFL